MIRVDLPATARWLVAVSLLGAAPQPAFADGAVARIGGTGMALAALQQIGAGLTGADPSVRIDVMPSMGTSGGIKALLERAVEIAVVARPLNGEERAKGLREAACMTTAVVFASPHRFATGLTKAQLPGLYADPSPKWPDGTPLKVILRSRAGSENPYLAAEVPDMAVALDKAYKRHGMPVGSTDQENAKLALQISGSLAIMTLLQIRAERLDLKVLPFDGVAPSAETIANKTYPLPIRVCIVLPADPAPAAMQFVRYFRSAAGKAIVESLGAASSD
jgi:phosphate transport system substrate-binding protein